MFIKKQYKEKAKQTELGQTPRNTRTSERKVKESTEDFKDLQNV